MPEIKNIEIDGDLYDVRYFFDCDASEAGGNQEGIDINRSDDGAHIGEMMGTRFPDENDEDEMDHFKVILKEWLDNNI